MCGRFALTIGDRDIEEEFQVHIPFDIRPRYNISPGQEIVAIKGTGEDKEAVQMRWGLIPHWADGTLSNVPQRMQPINARDDNLTSNMWKVPFRHRRCLIPASGFYEWQDVGETRKRPHFIYRTDQQLFSFAGLFNEWTPDSGDPVLSCSLITSSPNSIIKPIHDRMPVILTSEKYEPWLDCSGEETSVQEFLAPFPASDLHEHAVGYFVSDRHEGPECIAELTN